MEMGKLILILVAALVAHADAYGVVGSRVSAFGGKVMVSGATNIASMEMKKGKANVPPQMRQQLAKQREMAAMRQEMLDATKPGPDGLPVFNLFVRTPRANVSETKEEFHFCVFLVLPCTVHKEFHLTDVVLFFV